MATTEHKIWIYFPKRKVIRCVAFSRGSVKHLLNEVSHEKHPNTLVLRTSLTTKLKNTVTEEIRDKFHRVYCVPRGQNWDVLQVSVVINNMEPNI